MSFERFYTKGQFQRHPNMMQQNDFAANRLHFAAKRLVSPTVTGMFYPNSKRFNQESVGIGWTKPVILLQL